MRNKWFEEKLGEWKDVNPESNLDDKKVVYKNKEKSKEKIKEKSKEK